jgi:hypothetical protein
MEQEIAQEQVQLIPGQIVFKNFETLKNEALELSEMVSEVIVTPDNVKQSKKLVSAVSKKIKDLESNRISIKKQMMEPYFEFEEKVKEIVHIVDEAEGIVRKQIKSIEEDERNEKKQKINDLFDKRMRMYWFRDLIPFDDFLKSSHLNKTTSIDLVEREMVEFLEKIEKDFLVLHQMEDKDRLISLYLDTKDLSESLALFNKEKERRQQIQRSQMVSSKKEEKKFIITVYEKKDLKMIQMFMTQNDIKFHVPEV